MFLLVIYCQLRRHFTLYFQRDGIVDLSEVRDSITKSIGLVETGPPFIRSKIMLVFVLTYKQILSGTKKKKKKKKKKREKKEEEKKERRRIRKNRVKIIIQDSAKTRHRRVLYTPLTDNMSVCTLKG